jgi:hypothetical protein
VTKEIGAFGKQTLMVFNKDDASQSRDHRFLQSAVPPQRCDLRAHR